MYKSNEEFEELLNKGDAESLLECMEWLRHEEKRISKERERMEADELFFDKKMEILKSGYASLEADRKKLQRERDMFNAEKNADRKYYSTEAYEDLAGTLFAGVNSYLALKKRYRDLLKIFHPDNLCGDETIVKAINDEYSRLRDNLD